jgi:hypothetical protein
MNFPSVFLNYYTSTIFQVNVDSFQLHFLVGETLLGIGIGASHLQVSSFNIQELKGLGGIKASLC